MPHQKYLIIFGAAFMPHLWNRAFRQANPSYRLTGDTHKCELTAEKLTVHREEKSETRESLNIGIAFQFHVESARYSDGVLNAFETMVRN